MADFTVRVGLHGAEWEDYDVLRVEMEAEGFSAAVQGSGGMSYELPVGEYAVSGRRDAAAGARAGSARGGSQRVQLRCPGDGVRWARVVRAGADGVGGGSK